MSYFVVNIGRIVHRVRNFIAQKPPILLPQIVQLLFTIVCAIRSVAARAA